jgi:glycosyltransferase involved in cell wall biosynthesis
MAPEDAARPELGPALTRLRDAGVRVLPLGRSHTRSLSAWAPLVQLLRSGQVDVLHAHKFGSNAWGAIFGRAFGVPVILAHEHSWDFIGRRSRRLVDRHVSGRGADVYLAVAEDDKQQMTAVCGVPAERIRVMHSGIDSAPQAPPDPRAGLALDPRAPVVVSVGLLREVKAYDDLIRAAALLVPDHPGLRVLLVGGPDPTQPDEPERLRRLVRELQLEDTVAFLGARSDVFAVLAAADVAVCCSVSEGSPLSVMEYMEAARPVVATRVGGVPELIHDGVHGLLVEPSDPRALARALGELLDDPARAAEMGRRGRDRRRREFDIDETVRRLEGLYASLLATSRRRRPPWARPGEQTA